ncbi:lipoprotein [Nonomuraea recticatena]|uniref:Lipoprotein n=2 Tax=Nonomuraea recticatena TaxID=46178 RepID=A0ABN3TD81_9ACTN
MRKILAPLMGTVAVSLVIAGGGGHSIEGAAMAASSTPDETLSGMSDPNPSVRVGDTGIGKIIVDAQGRTLYLFEKDTGGKSTCYGECAKEWPPYLTTDAPRAGEGAKADLVSTTTRDDGSKQVVYGKWPLYYYHDDKKAGDTTGHDKEEFGAEWYALTAAGMKASG